MDEAAQQPQEAAEQPLITTPELKFRNSWQDWALRAIIFVAFIFFASGKFKATNSDPWGVIFQRIGFGQWFRYFTALIEMAGAFLVLISSSVEVGLYLLIGVMLGAVVIEAAIVRAPSEAFIPFAFMCAMIGFYLHRRRV